LDDTVARKLGCFISSGLVWVGFCCATLGAHAQDAGAREGTEPRKPGAGEPAETAEPAPARSIQAPELLEFVEASYPASAISAAAEGSVTLKLTVDASGAVSDAEVLQGIGHGLDEAARSAALRFRFAPARRDGAPVAAKILYSYAFKLPPAATATAAASPPAAAPPAARAPAPTAPERQLPPAARTSTEAAPSGATDAPALLEVTVQGAPEVERLRQSARAVHVVETEAAQKRTADLGEVLARTQGVGLRRAGGLGSSTRFSLNGLTDDQIRFFLDGVPLELAGYPFGTANVPVNQIDCVQIYRGVVPIRFGADALGGAVNLVTEDDVHGTHGSASYQIGSFGTHRLTLGVRTLDEPTGIFTSANSFFDHADNDYPVDVEVADQSGRLSPARVHRFHDAYTAGGANVQTGFVNRPWARRLLLRAFVTEYRKELQHNVVMKVPYGAVEYGELTRGASLRYEHSLFRRTSLELIAGYTHNRIHFLDAGECVYNWFGQCVRERRRPGEIEDRPRDQLSWEHSAFGRLTFEWRPHFEHGLRISVAPTFVTRTGDERRQLDPSARDPLSAERDLFTWVNGVEYEVDLFDDRLENIAFVKQYVQLARSEEPLPGGLFRERDRDTHRFGAGNQLRYRLTDGLYVKASYEWATRLPRPDEVFGDALLIVDNLELEPETSHNANAGLTADFDTAFGRWRGDVNGFLREADQLIVLLGNDRVFSYQNVYAARSIGVEASAGWTSPGGHLTLDGNATYVDFRNTSSQGTFGDFQGDRIPNRPYLFANAAAALHLAQVTAPNDSLTLAWDARYVHEFFRGWESVGLRQYKQTVDSQLVHALALIYQVEGAPLSLSFTSEVQNLTDQPAFDFFGVQRPGRAFYFKTTAEF